MAAFKADPKDLLFLPLGGSEEIGMNLNLYHYGGKWLMVDLGISFADERMPGVDILMPDPSFIEKRRKDLAGLVLTHAHEDHIGAVPYLWPRLRCPIYATPFTASLVRRKLMDADLLGQVDLIEVPLSGTFTVGPFEIELVTLTHSVPEPNALVLRTPVGTVLHTGDWKIDPDPVIGGETDWEALQRVADEGVLAMVGDSTNVHEPGRAGSERDLRPSFVELFSKRTGRIAVTCFASNVARLDSVVRAANEVGRHVALVGRSLWRMYDVARENGYLMDLPEIVSERDAGFLPRDKVVLLVTGSQGEPRAAMSKIADDAHPEIVLQRGDTAVFSSREIPGNEQAIGRVQDKLAARGIEIVTEREHHVHVSGHPCRDELVEMYQRMRPQVAIPVHGSMRHLLEHASLARSCQVQETVIPGNGTVIRLAPGNVGTIATVPTSGLALDGQKLRAAESDVLKDRRRMVFNGTASVSVVLNKKGIMLGDPHVSFLGVVEDGDEAEDLEDEAIDMVIEMVGGIRPAHRTEEAVREAVERAVRRVVRSDTGKRPVTTVHVVQV